MVTIVVAMVTWYYVHNSYIVVADSVMGTIVVTMVTC